MKRIANMACSIVGTPGLSSTVQKIFLVLVLLGIVSCGSIQKKRTAEDVQVFQEESERTTLYSNISKQHLITLTTEDRLDSSGTHVYVWDRERDRLDEVKDPTNNRPSLQAGEALLSVEPGATGPSIHFLDWISEERRTISVRLSSLTMRKRSDDASGPSTHEVVFTARESALFPFLTESDTEIFKAGLTLDTDSGTARLSHLEQLTFNDVDDREPSFSPDGEWIVFVRNHEGTRNVFLMDHSGDAQRPLTPNPNASTYHPVILPDNQRCLYVRKAGGTSSFYVCKLTGKGHRKASNEELKQRLFSWDDRTRHSYLMTDVFANQRSLRLLMELPRSLDLKELFTLSEWNAPGLKKYREKIRSARSERRLHQQERGMSLSTSVTHVADVGTLLDEPDVSPGDRSIEDFTRYLLSLDVPIFNGSLKTAIKRRDRWQEAVYVQTYQKKYAERVYRITQSYYDFSEQTQRAKILQKILDLNRKRRSIMKKRVESGTSPEKKLKNAEVKVNQAKARLEKARSNAKQARADLLSTAGLSPNNEQIHIEPASLQGGTLPGPVPDVRRFQGLMQVNHPELHRLKFLELRAAAIRDMGPPETRDQTSFGLSYGVGVDRFFGEAIDDFIAMSLGHTFALSHKKQKKSYQKQWTHEMKHYRRQRQQFRLDKIADLKNIKEELSRLQTKFQSSRSARKKASDTVRRKRIYRAGFQKPSTNNETPSPTELIDARIKEKNQQLNMLDNQADYYRKVGQYYFSSGQMRKFISFPNRSDDAEKKKEHRSLYLWKTLDVVLNPEQRKQFLNFCTQQGIQRVYVFLSRKNARPYLEAYNWEIGYLLDLLRERDIEAYALLGNPNWVKSFYEEEIDRLLDELMHFNQRIKTGQAGFQGIQLDVEPHSLPGWEEENNRSTLQEKYLDMLKRVRKQLQQDPRTSSLPLSVTIPHSWSRLEDKTFMNSILDRVDALSVMSYFTDPKSITKHAEPLVQRTSDKQIPVEVVLETHPGSGKETSFATHSEQRLLKAMEKVIDSLKSHPSFQGIALHDYIGLRKLLDQQHHGD